MTPYPGLQYLTWAVYLIIFALLLAKALRTPTRAHWDMVVFFGAAALIIIVSAAEALLGLPLGPWVADLTLVLAVALPYLLMRLVEAFADVPRWLLHGAELGFLVVVVAVLMAPSDVPDWLVAVAVALSGGRTCVVLRQLARRRDAARSTPAAIGLGRSLAAVSVPASATSTCDADGLGCSSGRTRPAPTRGAAH